MTLSAAAQKLDKQEFVSGTAIIKGRIKGYDASKNMMLPEITVSVHNHFTDDYNEAAGEIKSDGSFEISVPMSVKHQIVRYSVNSETYGDIVASVGKTVVMDFDFAQLLRNPEKPLTPEFSGDNADLNLALKDKLTDSFVNDAIRGQKAAKTTADMTLPQFKDYMLKKYDEYAKRIDTMSITKRAKQLLKIKLKCKTAYFLGMGEYYLEMSYRVHYNKPTDLRVLVPEFKKPLIREDYVDYPKLLDIDDIMMFYSSDFGMVIDIWGVNVENASIDSVRFLDNGQRVYNWSQDGKKEKLAQERMYKNILGNGESYFKDFLKLLPLFQKIDSREEITDSEISDVEKMRHKGYAEYLKLLISKTEESMEAEIQRGGYFVHSAGESDGEALLAEILNEFKDKVVLIDFWNTWCSGCRTAIKEMAPMEESFEGQDVAFVLIADDSSPIEDWNKLITQIKGHHYRLTMMQMTALMKIWDFSGFPSYVVLGKDGMTKDRSSSFQGAEYYKMKIESELKKPLKKQ